jgi:hypothetical protein
VTRIPLHSTSVLLGIHRKIERRHVELMKFVRSRPASTRNPWTEDDQKRHARLLKRWHDAVLELDRFEHPGAAARTRKAKARKK